MLIKWMTFEVSPGEREAFSAAQSDWAGLASARGFIAQIGGWANPERTRAAILSVWSDQLRHHMYMRRRQLEFEEARRSYATGRISFANETLRIEGSQANLARAAERANFLRITDCVLERETMTGFIEQQRASWQRNAGSSGFIAGSLMRVQQDDPRFLVASFWDHSMMAGDYSTSALPMAGRHVATQVARETITGYAVPVVDAWRVLAS